MEELDKVKTNFTITYMCAFDDPDYINCNEEAIPRHISVVTSFYRRFAKRLTEMMENNPETNLISIMGQGDF